jgi:hypothetical protein
MTRRRYVRIQVAVKCRDCPISGHSMTASGLLFAHDPRFDAKRVDSGRRFVLRSSCPEKPEPFGRDGRQTSLSK